MDILEAIELHEQDEEYSEEDQDMFNRMVNLLLAIHHDNLAVEQLDKLVEIIGQVEFLGGDLEERKIYKRAKKSHATTKQYARNYYRKNRIKLEKRKKKISNSAAGKKRARNKSAMAKQGKAPSGRKKVIYHTQGHTQ